MGINRKTAIFFGIVLSSLSSCTLGPDYVRPELALPKHYRDDNRVADDLANSPWKSVFKDEKLRDLVQQALNENRDLQVATARIAEARARLGFVRADQFPRLDGRAAANRADPSNELADVGIEARNDFGVAGDLSFEVDLWGRLSRATEAERAQLLATEFAYRSVTTSLVFQVAATYFLLLDLDNEVASAVQTLENRKASTSQIRSKFLGGISPEIELNQAQIDEASVAAQLATLKRRLRQAENSMSVLLGRTPYQIPRGASSNMQLAQQDLPPSLPASLIEQRPDVRAAEEVLKSETARIGVAEAARLPSLSLYGFIGIQTRDLDHLGISDTGTWGFGADALGPILNYRKNLSQIEGAEARTEAALKAYEQAVLVSFQEVEDALIGIQTYRDELDARIMQEKAASHALMLSTARYNEGVTSYLEVLDVQRSLFTAELAASASQRDYSISIIQLYRALGGGWKE